MIDLEYTEVDRLLYPNIDIGESQLHCLGRFGKARLEYLHSKHFEYYRELLIMGKLADHCEGYDKKGYVLSERLQQEYMVSGILKDQTGSSFAELMNQGYSLSDCLAIIETSVKDQGLAFGDMWSSSEAAKAGLILLGDSADNFNTTLGQMSQSTGATDEAFDKLQTNSYTIQKAINQLKNTAIELGTAIMQVLAPIITSLSEKISALTKWFSGLSDGTKQTIVVITMIVAAIGPVLIIVGKVISAVGTIMTIIPKLAGVINTVKTAFAALNVTMLANPIVLIIAAIAALVTAFVYLWNTNEDFRQFWIDLWENIKIVAITVWNAIKDFFTAVWEGIKVIAETVWNTLSSFFSAIWNGIKTTIGSIYDTIKGGFDKAVNFIKGLVRMFAKRTFKASQC